MHVFHIQYRNTQGTLMRILTAASRRGIELPYVQAEPVGHAHEVTLMLKVNEKQAGQLFRDWHAVVDVTDVRAGSMKGFEQHSPWAMPHPPSTAGVQATGAAASA
jgi:acetolactate synthase small subunit